MDDLSPYVARLIIEQVGSSGTPPEYGVHLFSVGLDTYLSVIEKEYLATFIKQGGSTFKLVEGVYGGGKTHFLYSVRDLAWKHNFVVSYVTLSPTNCPFHRLELVYSAIARGLIPPPKPEELLSSPMRGIPSLLRSWIGAKLHEYRDLGFRKQVEIVEELMQKIDSFSGIESTSFLKAIKLALKSILDNKEYEFESLSQWLTGEKYDTQMHKKHFGIMQPIDKTSAFSMLRSLAQILRQMDYAGLVVLLDEAERVASLSSSQREYLLNNLRELIDECGHLSFPGVMIFYAVPDENFLEGRTQIYEALRQRLTTVFDEINPTGIKIQLENLPIEPMECLLTIGQKLKGIYEKAYDCRLDEEATQQMIQMVANEAYNQRYGDIGYKRLFVKNFVTGLNYLRQKRVIPALGDIGF